MSRNNYMNLYLDSGISNEHDQARYSRMLDGLVAERGIAVDGIVGLGEKGTGNNLDLYVVHRQTIFLVTEVGFLKKNKRVVVQTVCPIAAIARLRGTQEGFKGSDITVTANDADGGELFKIVWGYGGPDWVAPMIERQREHLFSVISKAMDEVADTPARCSVSSSSSKAKALVDWAADVVKVSGVGVTPERVEEHANMIASMIRIFVFSPLGQTDDLSKFYPGGSMPEGKPIHTFDELYALVVHRIGSAVPVDRGIDEYLAGSWNEYVRGCRETYS